MREARGTDATVKAAVRIEKRWGDLTFAVEVPYGADVFQLAIAVRELDRVAPVPEGFCSACRAPEGAIHAPDCVFAPPDQIERSRVLALEEGMRP